MTHTRGAATLADPAQKYFITPADAEAKFRVQGVTADKRVICYCGGTLYDGSMGEWAKDPSLPIETD